MIMSSTASITFNGCIELLHEVEDAVLPANHKSSDRVTRPHTYILIRTLGHTGACSCRKQKSQPGQPGIFSRVTCSAWLYREPIRDLLLRQRVSAKRKQMPQGFSSQFLLPKLTVPGLRPNFGTGQTWDQERPFLGSQSGRPCGDATGRGYHHTVPK